MKIRQRLRIMESNNQKDLKIKLFFLADQMGLSVDRQKKGRQPGRD